MKETIEHLSREFFTKLCIDFSDLGVSEEIHHIYRVEIKSPDS